MPGPVITPASLTPLGSPFPGAAVPIDSIPVIMADKIDPMTGEFESLLSGRDPVDAQVLYMMTIAAGSGAAVMNKGQRFADVTHIGDEIARVLDSVTRQTLENLSRRGDIFIQSVEVITADPGINPADFAEIQLKYLNLRANGKPERTQKVPLR